MFQRFINILKSKFSKVLDRAENVDETLDYAYEQQLNLLQQVKRGVADVVTAKKQIEMQANRLDGQIQKLDEQARAALSHGREDLARAALERKAGLQQQKADLDAQIGDLEAKQAELETAQKTYADRVARFRSQKEVTKAQYRAAEAMVQIGEAATGIGRGMADAGRAIERARDKTEQMQARAGAIDELVASGALEDVSGESPIDRELRELAQSSQVESELARLKGELGAGGKDEQRALSEGDAVPSATEEREKSEVER